MKYYPVIWFFFKAIIRIPMNQSVFYGMSTGFCFVAVAQVAFRALEDSSPGNSYSMRESSEVGMIGFLGEERES